MMEDRQLAIYKDNKLLGDRIRMIHEGKGYHKRTTKDAFKLRSLNIISRRKEMKRISIANEKILQRILELSNRKEYVTMLKVS